MEDALRDNMENKSEMSEWVLILVLMEDALRDR